MPLWLTLTAVRKFGPWVAVAFGLLALFYAVHHAGAMAQKAKDDRVITALNTTIANVRTTTAAAQASDTAHAAAVKASQDAITEKSNADLETKLADARADVKRLSDRQAATRRSGAAGVPAAADTTSGATDASAATVVDDAGICAENTVKSEAWLDWWRDVSR